MPDSSTLTPLYWILAAAVGAACIVLGLALQHFFIEPVRPEPRVRLFQDASVLLALSHAGAVLYLGPPTVANGLAGIALFTLGTTIFLAVIEVSRRTPMPRAFLPVLPDRLITTGPFRFVRHPVYIAYTAFWLGAPAATGKWWLLPVGIGSVVLYVIAARQEEARWLASSRAAEYRDYMTRTGRFFPRLRRPRSQSGPRTVD
ncbi:MAG: methyltransferase family protein [Vicinamibacteria bacterium]